VSDKSHTSSLGGALAKSGCGCSQGPLRASLSTLCPFLTTPDQEARVGSSACNQTGTAIIHPGAMMVAALCVQVPRDASGDPGGVGLP
jgi:hypothetical protein